MAENPLATLGRVLGGVILMQGRLGHQVLGQLLVMNSNEIALAAASVVIAGTTNQRSAVGEMLLRTVAPAVAVRLLLNKQEERLERKQLILDERERVLRKRETRTEVMAKRLALRSRVHRRRRIKRLRRR